MEITTTFLRCEWLGEELERLRLHLQYLGKGPHLVPDAHDIARRNWVAILTEARYYRLYDKTCEASTLDFLKALEGQMQEAYLAQSYRVDNAWDERLSRS